MNKTDKKKLDRVKNKYREDYVALSKLNWNHEFAWLVHKLDEKNKTEAVCINCGKGIDKKKEKKYLIDVSSGECWCEPCAYFNRFEYLDGLKYARET